MGRRDRGVVLASACGLLLGLSVDPAIAVPSQFGSEGEGAGQLSAPRGVAVDRTSGDVFLADQMNERVDRFAPEGEFKLAWGWGVADGTTAAFQTCMATCFAGVPGPGAGQFRFPQGVAVDNSSNPSLHGDVYVVDQLNQRVQKFAPDGEFLLMFGGEVNTSTHGNVCIAGEQCQAGVAGSTGGRFQFLGAEVVAVDASGTVYVGDLERVQRFSPAGVFEGETPLLGIGAVEHLAVDSAGDLYVVASGLAGVHEYTGGGLQVGERDAAALPSQTSIAMGPADELLVYDQAAGHVEIYDATGTQLASLVQTGQADGVAYSPPAKALYLPHEVGEGAHVSVLALPPPGPLVLSGSERVDQVLPVSAVAHALVNAEGPAATSYHFDYGPTEAYGSSTTPVELTGAPFEDQPAQGTLEDLSPATVYHFRVVVTKGTQTAFGPDEKFTSAPAVSVEDESVSQVSSSSARLETVLNAHGLSSRFHFQYGTTTAYGLSAPEPEGDAGSSSSGASLSVTVEGLAAGSTYHYRVIAHNALGEVTGSDRTFTTQGVVPAGLADGRGFELVSPANKHGVLLEPIGGFVGEGALIQAAGDGGAITYVSLGPVSDETPGSRTIVNSQLLSTRTGSSWATSDITTPHEEVAGVIPGQLSEYLSFSSDLSVGLVEPFGATPLTPALMGEHGERTPYRRETNGAFTPLVTASNTPPGVRFAGEETQPAVFINGVSALAATPDGRRIVLRSPQPLTKDFATDGKQSLYEWEAGSLQPVSILANGRSTGEEALAAVLGHADFQSRGAISQDGSRVAFETNAGHLYVRDLTLVKTVQLDVPEAGVTKPGRAEAVFQLATPDGSRVFFTDEARLTTDATATPAAPDLYVCDLAVVAGQPSCHLKDLTVAAHPGEAAGVLNDVIGTGDAGRYVYFVANGALAPGAVHGNCDDGLNPVNTSPAASCNLYVRDTRHEATTLVAVLSNHDAVDWRGGGEGANLQQMTSRVSPDGRWLAFMSTRALTGYDNRDARSGQPDAEVFLYHASEDLSKETGALTCASCDPTGARPVGFLDPENSPGPLVDRSQEWRAQWLAASVPGWTPVSNSQANYQSRYLSNSGRLFFNSFGGLVPSDANGTWDVYEYEPAGVGSCSLPSGCVALMSGGSSDQESAFLDASETGEDVFVLTAAKLAQQDTDTALDVYDAHVCTASIPCPAGTVTVPPACTTTDSCRPAPTPQPGLFGAPASSTFTGAGNVTPPPAGGGQRKPACSSPQGAPAKGCTRKQNLTKALARCRRVFAHSKNKRATCESTARTHYGRRQQGRQSKNASAAAARSLRPLRKPSV